jgi:hypothetical protein
MKMLKSIKAVHAAGLIVASGVLAGCSTTEKGAAYGGAGGAVIGGIAGGLPGAAIGAGAGALGGAAVGALKENSD